MATTIVRTADADADGRGSDPVEGYSQGVKDFYGSDVHPETEEGSIEDVEAEYHQPPKPAEAGLGETITLTGTNIGVRMRVTVTGVKRVVLLPSGRVGAREHRDHELRWSA